MRDYENDEQLFGNVQQNPNTTWVLTAVIGVIIIGCMVLVIIS